MVGLHAILIGPIIEFWFQWILHSENNVTELKKNLLSTRSKVQHLVSKGFYTKYPASSEFFNYLFSDITIPSSILKGRVEW